MHKFLIVSGLLFAASGCKNSNYCAGNPDNNCNEHPDGAKQIDGMEALDCTVAGCGDSGKVCDTTTKACVECTVAESAACTGTAPVCKNDACTACALNADCPSDACLPSGACAAASDVAYVKAGGVGDCTSPASACGILGTAVGTSRPYIRIDGSVPAGIASLTSDRMLLGNDDGTTSTLTQATAAAAIEISGAAGPHVVIENLTIDGSTSTQDNVRVDADITHLPTLELRHCTITRAVNRGVYSSGGTVTITRSAITANTGGGVDLSDVTFHLENTFITQNGNASPFGGLRLVGGSGSLAFVTLADNHGNGTNDGHSRGLQCGATAATIDSSILHGNETLQFEGTGCTFTYTNAWPGSAPTGATNMTTQLTFSGSGNYHLPIGSPMVDAANPAASEPIDVDGNARPQGNARDIGADELMP